MSIEKKSLISTLKTTKKANVASAPTKIEAGKTSVGLTKNRIVGLTKNKAVGLTKNKAVGLTKNKAVGLTKNRIVGLTQMR